MLAVQSPIGNIGSIAVQIKGRGNTSVADAIEKLAEAISHSTELPEDERRAAMESLEVIAAEAIVVPAERKSATRTLFKGLGTTLQVGANLAQTERNKKKVIDGRSRRHRASFEGPFPAY